MIRRKKLTEGENGHTIQKTVQITPQEDQLLIYFQLIKEQDIIPLFFVLQRISEHIQILSVCFGFMRWLSNLLLMYSYHLSYHICAKKKRALYDHIILCFVIEEVCVCTCTDACGKTLMEAIYKRLNFCSLGAESFTLQL